MNLSLSPGGPQPPRVQTQTSLPPQTQHSFALPPQVQPSSVSLSPQVQPNFALPPQIQTTFPHQTQTTSLPPQTTFPPQAQPASLPPQTTFPQQTQTTFPPQTQPSSVSQITFPPQTQPTSLPPQTQASFPPQTQPSSVSQTTFPPQAQPSSVSQITFPPQTQPSSVSQITFPPQAQPSSVSQTQTTFPSPTTVPELYSFERITSPQTQQTVSGNIPPVNLQLQQFPTQDVISPQTSQFQNIISPTTQPFKIQIRPTAPPLTSTNAKPVTLAPLSAVPGPILSSSSPRARTDQIWRTFQRDDLFLLENDTQTPYRRRNDENKTSVHWGQRKLALTTLAMINFYWDSSTVANPIVVYAGAAPGQNLNFVMELYPEIEWYLYDPHPIGFKINPEYKSRVHIYGKTGGLFTDQIAHAWAGRKDVFFISDIRTVEIDETTGKEKLPSESGVWNNMKMQERWVKIIKPVVALLKFRLPYSGEKFSNEIDFKRGLAPYLAGIVLKQPWAGRTSTETRLLIPYSSIINNQYPIHNWNIKVYEGKMFHLNSVIREINHYYNPFYLNDHIKREEEINPPELINDWDSMTETTILNDYLIKRGTMEDHLKGIRGLSNLLTLSLQRQGKKRFGTKDKTSTLDYRRKHPRN